MLGTLPQCFFKVVFIFSELDRVAFEWEGCTRVAIVEGVSGYAVGSKPGGNVVVEASLYSGGIGENDAGFDGVF